MSDSHRTTFSSVRLGWFGENLGDPFRHAAPMFAVYVSRAISCCSAAPRFDCLWIFGELSAATVCV